MASHIQDAIDKIAPPLDFQNLRRKTSAIEAPVEAGFLSIIVFGASGDLAKKKTFPALFNLYRQGFLPGDTVQIIGYSRSEMTVEALRSRLKGYLKVPASHPVSDPQETVNSFLELVSYVAGPYDEGSGFEKLEAAIVDKEKSAEGVVRRLFYMALPPSVYPVVAVQLREHNMNKRGWTRVIVEKPFGKDLASAEELSSQLGKLFTEDQMYRIDHYLGKEIVQNMLVMRFANLIFLPLWNRENIANVQIVFKEDFGTEGRGGYFDQYGIIRDIIQNHLMQVLCLVAMEKPVSLSPEDIRDEKVKVLRCIEPIQDSDVVLGQYGGYLDDPTVPKGSKTPTYASIVLRINNERWDGVPFIMKAGKALDSRKAEIRVQFRDVPGDIFRGKQQVRNEFVMRLQPSEAIYLKLTVKQPGLEMAATQSELDLSYHQRYEDIVIPEAYERLILDAIRGDQQHFLRRDELRAAWEIFTPLLHRIDGGELETFVYKQGSRGPPEADELSVKAGYTKTGNYVWNPSLKGTSSL
eukprot:TRINITY_DN501_c2_g2_i1.p1 TRINITY_DN501_c2_g2~~TRINITY_DN501_c2_g2_i1.p1  ORF type:complete len:523 (+),score=91.19 TRINITY_DN501_c2_g2_i1:216-1784(+)